MRMYVCMYLYMCMYARPYKCIVVCITCTESSSRRSLTCSQCEGTILKHVDKRGTQNAAPHFTNDKISQSPYRAAHAMDIHPHI